MWREWYRNDPCDVFNTLMCWILQDDRLWVWYSGFKLGVFKCVFFCCCRPRVFSSYFFFILLFYFILYFFSFFLFFVQDFSSRWSDGISWCGIRCEDTKQHQAKLEKHNHFNHCSYLFDFDLFIYLKFMIFQFFLFFYYFMIFKNT